MYSGHVIYFHSSMKKYIFFGAVLSALVLVGAGCNKETPPVTGGTTAPETAAVPAEENKEEAKTDASGTVKIDIRQDEQSASPKALAGDKEPASHKVIHHHRIAVGIFTKHDYGETGRYGAFAGE